jgi:hypothetical protein
MNQEIANHPVAILSANIAKLNERDQTFARSLLASKTLSEKQHFWIDVLAKRATGVVEERKTTAVAQDLAAIMAIFGKAAKRLKAPAIVLGWKVEDTLNEVRLNVAKPGTRVPGSINVVNTGSRDWYGRILADGRFEHSPRLPAPVPTALIELLGRFAAEPAKVAAEHGKLTGRCCFCNLPLGRGKDKRSVAVGYGPDCAENYGLAWGTTAAKEAGDPLAVAA